MGTNEPLLDGLTRIDRTNVKTLALEQIKRYILSGIIKPGERLPSERVLSERLGVGRSSVREALKILEAVGFVEARVGEGTFLSAQSSSALGRVIGLSLMQWGGTIVEIIGARLVIESGAAQVAAERATEDDIAALARELQRMETAPDFGAYLAADMQFHRLIGRATQNTVLQQITTSLIDMLEEALHEGHGDELQTSSEKAGTHHEVYAAIVRRDGAAAADAMERHLRFTTELWQTLVVIGTALPDS